LVAQQHLHAKRALPVPACTTLRTVKKMRKLCTKKKPLTAWRKQMQSISKALRDKPDTAHRTKDIFKQLWG